MRWLVPGLDRHKIAEAMTAIIMGPCAEAFGREMQRQRERMKNSI